MDDPLHVVFAELGEAGIARLVAAFYEEIPHDDILGPMYPDDDLEGAAERLCDFLVLRTGGPTRYLENRGHPALRRRHAPFPITQQARDRWMEIMGRALDSLDADQNAKEVLRKFLAETATFLININQQPGLQIE